MASSSSSSNMALPRANGSKYDVFLSFRGEDTRHSFTDHLYAALVHAGILTFRDSDDAERGEELKEEIEKAIKASDASIIVLSGNYATSTWCLDELSLILDQRRDRSHFVLPVFYHVDPSHVGKQKGRFKISASSSRRWTNENVKRWKSALTEVVGVIGMSLVGPETKFIKKVVDTIYNRLERKQIYLPRNITGMDARYAEITSWLRQYENQFLVIYGMAGSGKSTLARYIVHSNCQHFECYSIVESIDSRCQEPYKMVRLQQQLCDDISKRKDTRRIPSHSQGTSRIEVLLEKTKALIILDDVVKVDQLDDLLGLATVNKESKIIITTHNDIICDWFVSKSKRFQKYTMRLLNDDEALELLSLHAFQSKIPKDGYTELAQQVVRYCDGSPLALEVLGSSLSHINTITSWESELSSYKKSINDKINEVLIKSYDSIPSIHEKELFLHIACFFVGKDMNYVVKILKPDYPAESKIETLIKRGFLYVTTDNKLMMHRLLQEMGRYLADRESRTVSERTRVWRNTDSYHMLRRKKSSDSIEGLALDIQMLMKEDNMEPSQLKELSTYSLQQMDQLKYLQLNFVQLTGSYEDLSEHIRWLCWVGFDKSTVHAEMLTRSIVALDMSYSCLEKFEPPTVMPSLKILNLKDSPNLLEIRSMNKIPSLETLIIWNCRNLFRICRGVGDLERLSVVIMTGCEKLFKRGQINISVELETSTLGGARAHELSFPLPHSLQRVLLNECNLECTEYFPLSFSHQLYLQYINLGNGLFEILPRYNHLKDLRVLDLRNCSNLKRLICLPSTLAELYIYDCKSIEKISFESGRFTLQEFGYEGCINLSEIEGLAKLLLVAKLDETDLGHLIWLKEYQDHEVCLIGDYELTKGRSCHLQMLYEFNIMSTSLPDIMHPNLMPEYRSQSTSLSFEVPACPKSSRLKGLNVTFKYTISGDDWVWFARIKTTNGVDLMYSPIVFGKPGIGQVGIWLSYWPIGNLLDVGEEVKVSIVVMSGLEVLECGASLVYTDDNVAPEILKIKTGWVETFGRDLSGFHLRKGSYYLCQRDIYKMMEIGRLTSGWLSTLVGDTIDDTEVRGWRRTGRPHQSYQSFRELKTGRYIIHGQEMKMKQEEIDKIAEVYSSSFVDKTEVFPSSIHDETTISRTTSELSDMSIEFFDQQFMDISEASVINETMEFTSSSLQEKMDSAISESSKLTTKEESGKFADKIMSLEPATLTDKMKSATTFVSTDTETKVEGTSRVRKKETPHIVLGKEPNSMDSTSSIEMNSVSEKVPASPLRVPPSPSRFSMSPKLDRIGSVHLTMSQVARATQNFAPSLKLGEGGFGTVYKAQLPDGQVVAIKRAKKEHFDALQSEFRSEVELLSKIDHRNLVKLLGYVDKGNERLIITEYVTNGTLREHLDGIHGNFLDFSQRLEICIDIAHGLTYLHLYAEKQIIHRDVKSSNILLTERLRAKVADFGFARLGDAETDKTHVVTKVRGTVGYLDPEYMRTYQLTPKSDVYSFGVLLIEILTGRRPIESKRSPEEKVTIRWAFGKYNDGDIMDLVDPQMKEAVDGEIFAKMLGLAFQCAAPTRADRPDMKVVGEQLWVIRMDYLRHGRRG